MLSKQGCFMILPAKTALVWIFWLSSAVTSFALFTPSLQIIKKPNQLGFELGLGFGSK